MHAASLSIIIRRVRRLWFQYRCRARSTSPRAGEKTLQVRLQNEITRKERIPIDDVNAIIGPVFHSIAAIIKSRLNKVMDLDTINDLFDQLRNVPEQLNWPGVAKIPIEPVR